MNNVLCLTESQEQQRLFRWATYEVRGKHPCLALLFAIPNGGNRNAVTGAILKAEGVKRGVPDIFLPVACGEYHGLFIEMKRQQGGRVSVEQKRWIKELTEKGYKCSVCKGFEEAKKEILTYIST